MQNVIASGQCRVPPIIRCEIGDAKRQVAAGRGRDRLAHSRLFGGIAQCGAHRIATFQQQTDTPTCHEARSAGDEHFFGHRVSHPLAKRVLTISIRAYTTGIRESLHA